MGLLKPLNRPVTKWLNELPEFVKVQRLIDNGAFFVNDISTMYQDAAGTTPVTAVDDPVGLWIDQSQGGEGNLGAELTPAGNWTALSDATVTQIGDFSARVQTDPGDNIGMAEKTADGFVVGGFYRASFVVSGTDYDNFRMRISSLSIQGAGDTLDEAETADGTYSYVFKATATTMFFGVVAFKTGGEADVTFSDFSIKHLPGNHATQSTAAARPLLKQDGSGNYYLQFDGVDDFLDNSDFDASTGPLSIVFAARNQFAGSANRPIVSLGDQSGDGTLYRATNEHAVRVSGGSRLYDEKATGVSPDAISIVRPDSADVADVSAWKNGSLLGISSTFARTLDTAPGLGISADPGGNAPSGNDVYSVMVIKEELTAADRKLVEAYLASLSGVTL